MKKKILIVLTIAFSLLSQTQKVLAQEAAQSTTPNASEQLLAQISVTQNAIQQVLAKLNNERLQRKNGKYSTPDFDAKAAEFNARAEMALIQFEKETSQIFEEANYYIQRLEEINNIKGYTESQKSSMIKEWTGVSQVSFNNLTVRYRRALYKLYLLDSPVWMSDEDLKFLKTKSLQDYQSISFSISYNGDRLLSNLDFVFRFTSDEEFFKKILDSEDSYKLSNILDYYEIHLY
nr:hypothetical protein [Pseudobdellovibrionaceae bacterium]